jgi:hypothetical protein
MKEQKDMLILGKEQSLGKETTVYVVQKQIFKDSATINSSILFRNSILRILPP